MSAARGVILTLTVGLALASLFPVAWAGAGTPIPAGNGRLTDGIPFVTMGGSEGSGSEMKVGLFFGIQASSGRLMAVFAGAPSAPRLAAQDYSLVGNAQITPGAWHHAAATYDGQTLRLFLDGRLDAALTLASPVVPDLVSAREVYLAGALSSDGQGRGFFKGVLDEVRIWEVARSPNEIQAAILGQRTAKEACDNVAKQLQPFLKDWKP